MMADGQDSLTPADLDAILEAARRAQGNGVRVELAARIGEMMAAYKRAVEAGETHVELSPEAIVIGGVAREAASAGLSEEAWVAVVYMSHMLLEELITAWRAQLTAAGLWPWRKGGC